MWKAISSLLAFALLVLAGCGSSTPATPSAQTQLCKSLANLHGTVQQLTQVNGSTTIGEVKSYGRDIGAALTQVQESAATVHTARVSDLNSAVDTLQHTINTLPNSTTLSQAAATIKTQAASVQTARAQLGDQVGCSTPAATP
jgi:hypothetical protein